MTTRSSPPSESPDARPAALASFDTAAFEGAFGPAPDDGMIFFCVEDAPRQACKTLSGGDASLTFQTSLLGRVVSVENDSLVLQIGEEIDGGLARIRHHLPTGITLDALLGHVVSFELSQIYRGRGRATIDAELRDAAGRMILWVRDGRFPSDGAAHGLSVRLIVDRQETRLAVRADGGVTSLRSPGTRALVIGGAELSLALVRVGADDVSFALLRR